MASAKQLAARQKFLDMIKAKNKNAAPTTVPATKKAKTAVKKSVKSKKKKKKS